MLEKLDQDKEILIDIDWDYLQDDWSFFKLSFSFDDFELKEWYYLETKDELLFWRKRSEEEQDLKQRAKIAKKYMKQEWYEKVEREWMCYCFDAF